MTSSTSVVLMSPYAFRRVLVDLWPATQPARAGSQGQLISLTSLIAAEACLQVYGVTEELGSPHITPRHSTSSSSSPIHPSVPSPLPPSFPCHRVHCANAAFTAEYSRCLYSFLSSLPPSASFTSFFPPCLRGGRNVNGALSSKPIFSPSRLPLFSPLIFSRKMCKSL